MAMPVLVSIPKIKK